MSQEKAPSNSYSSATFLLVILGFALVGIVWFGVYMAETMGRDSPLAVALAAVAIVSFLSLLRIQKTDPQERLLSESSMRSAIAGTIVIEYTTLVAIVAFFQESPDEINPVTQMMINNFTTIVGIVIAFYFGSSAYVQSRNSRDPSKSS